MRDLTQQVDKIALAERFGRAAAVYDHYAQLQQHVGQSLLALVPTARYQHVLDLGCGTGFFLPGLQPLAEQLWALDLSPGMLAVAGQRGVANGLLCADAEQLPFRPETLDLVFSSLALQWCRDLPATLAGLAQTLRPGGVLAFAILTDGSLPELRSAWRAVDNAPHVNRFVEANWLFSEAEKCGFALLSREIQRHCLHYATLRELLMSLKGVGASQVNDAGSRGLAGRQRWSRFTVAYEQLRDPVRGTLPLSYDVCYGVLKR